MKTAPRAAREIALRRATSATVRFGSPFSKARMTLSPRASDSMKSGSLLTFSAADAFLRKVAIGCPIIAHPRLSDKWVDIRC